MENFIFCILLIKNKFLLMIAQNLERFLWGMRVRQLIRSGVVLMFIKLYSLY